jgi:hypothetical protein
LFLLFHIIHNTITYCLASISFSFIHTCVVTFLTVL